MPDVPCDCGPPRAPSPLSGDEAVRNAVEAYVGCLAGASLLDDLRRMMADAGLAGLRLTPKAAYVETLTAGNDPLYQQVQAALPVGTRSGDYITSMDLAAVKGGAACCSSA